MKDKYTIIKLKEEGASNRGIQRATGIHRKTVAKYWSEYQAELAALGMNEGLREVQELIVSAPKYDAERRGPRKYTAEIDALLDTILASECVKDAVLGGGHKQKLTGVQIHGLIRAAGHDIGLSVVCAHIKEKRGRQKEAFIRQEYEFGQRLEYDFGEVRLVIGGIARKYYMAVLSSPGASFRWAYLYPTQKKEVFLDSHVRFFEMSGGAYGEVVYDNMKNVVTRFIGRSEKQLNEDLVKMSLYYGFRINVTNCFSGNEKGHVEGSVKTIRNKAFALRYSFDTAEDAEAYLEERLLEMNAGSSFEEERRHLGAYRPPLDLARISEQAVDKYSFVRVENHFYSVPEYLVGHKVMVKNYQSEIAVYSGGKKVCGHKKREGYLEATVDITHYLGTLAKKPGAIRNSVALKCCAELKAVFERDFVGREREFVRLLKENEGRPMREIAPALASASGLGERGGDDGIEANVTANAKSQIAAVSRLFMVRGGEGHVN